MEYGEEGVKKEEAVIGRRVDGRGTVRGTETGGKVRGGRRHKHRNRAKVIDYEGLHAVPFPFCFLHFFILW